MKNCNILVNGSDIIVRHYMNKDYDRTLFLYMRNGILKGVDFWQGERLTKTPYDNITKEDILQSKCTEIMFNINREYFTNNIVTIEQALHLCLHISEIYCNTEIYNFDN
jgi:hypothetical protein